jgi:hypothetical protein
MMIFKKIKNQFRILNLVYSEIKRISSAISRLQESVGRLELRQIESLGNDKNIIENEFRVFSQWGEDGIIQYLVRNIEIRHKIFVEFGVQNYIESNTRFLLINNNWSGLVIDGNPEEVIYIKNDPIYWQYNIKAINAFITTDNINQIFLDNGIQGDIGLLSIDIDGNDYWIWEAINSINPAIIVCEYNFRFGADKAVTVPYNPGFIRTKSHHSNIYFGASLRALCLLAESKGYSFIGCNSAGINAFFVRKEIKPDYIREMSVEDGYVEGKFRESRNQEGELIFLNLEEEKKLLESLPLIAVV